jgi:CubicO group peptidase (beta-lactamase class C family)
MEAAIRTRVFPGAAVAFGRADDEPFVRCYGHLAYGAAEPVTPQTRYDLLCLSKPLGVGALLALAVARGDLDLDAPVAATLPRFAAGGKAGISWRHLLSHAGGLAPSHSYERLVGATRDEVIDQVLSGPPRCTPGTHYAYSCDGFVVMGLALERHMGCALDDLVGQRVLAPLGMRRTGYGRAAMPLRGNVAPMQHYRSPRPQKVVGEVCEPLASALGGVAGNAGLFASVNDVGRFARAWLGHAPPGSRPLFDPAVTACFQRPADPERLGTTGLAWDTRSPSGYTVAGRAFGPRSFGHTGAGGCSLWIDPGARTWVALLSNALYETDGRRRYVWVRPRVTEIAHRILEA